MADFLGRAPILDPPRSTAPVSPLTGAQWPLISDYPAGLDWDFPIVSHRFGELATFAYQRYQVGIGNRRFHFQRRALTRADRDALTAFYSSVQGSYQYFTYAAPNTDGSTTLFNVIFDVAPLSITDLASMSQTGIVFVEVSVPTDPTLTLYSTGSPVVRSPVPGSPLSLSLLSQVQKLIPLVEIRARDTAVPTIYLSDRRVKIDNILYLPRLLGVGEPNSDVLMSQSISGSADSVSFSFGNADRAMSALNRDTSLRFAQISLSLYHVQTSTIVNLWKGIIISFSLDGSAEFRVQCSDGLYPITQNYPRRVISRQCWKTFNTEPSCPWQRVSALGNAASCDYFFNSPNGCLSHGMSTYFGGHPAFPQSVSIKDNGTGIIGGFGRSTVTSTSIVADNLWGNPLPEIWCNDYGFPAKATWVNAIVTSVRDESDFLDVLGIVGVGPIGEYEHMSLQTNADGFKFIVSSFADGFPPHGFKISSQLEITGAALGLREVVGSDPVDPVNSPFSLGEGSPQRYDVPDATYSNILTGQPRNILPFAAGTAFVELRYAKPSGSGLAPSTTESHNLLVPVRFGLTGAIFDPSGNRAFVSGLTNPFWVAVSTYLRALGLDNATPSAQLSTFVLSSVINNLSNGCAQIADLLVPPVVGDQSSTETQYTFQGTLSEFKPYRDWLTEILACSLGYYSFEYGKLRLGIRSHACDSSAFSHGNILYQSLSLTPVEAQFEYLKADFANVDLQGQQDMVSYQDKDYSRYFGREGAPLTARQRIVGLSTLSQGLRLVATRVREEIGGILRPDQPNPHVEFDNNFLVTFKTTLLALETGVGDVISITHPDIPTYPGPVPGSATACPNFVPAPNRWKYRIQKWTLHKDYSVTIVARSVTDSMYDLTVGPRPADVLTLPLPALFFPIPLHPAWAPYHIQASASDALFPSEWTFETDQEYVTLADGSSSAQLVVTGKLPINSFAPSTGTPLIGSVSRIPTGGSIPGGTTLRVTIIAFNSDGLPSPPAEIAIVQFSGALGLTWQEATQTWVEYTVQWGANTGSATLSGILWPRVSGLTSYGVFASDTDNLICLQQSGSLTNTGGNIYSPSSITIPGPLFRSTYALPSPFVSKVRIKAKVETHPGVMDADVTSVSASTIVCSSLIDSTPGGFNPASPSRYLSVIGRPDTPCPFASYRITGWNGPSGTFTVSPDPVGTVLAGDRIAVRTQAVSDNEPDQTQIQDLGYANITNAYVGLTTVAEVGKIIRVIAGLSRGETRKIFSNTSNQIAWDLPMHLDFTSVWVIEEASWAYVADSTSFSNSDPTKATSLSVPVDNFPGQALLVTGFTVDTDDVESPDGEGPVREEWIYGDSGQTNAGGVEYL